MAKRKKSRTQPALLHLEHGRGARRLIDDCAVRNHRPLRWTSSTGCIDQDSRVFRPNLGAGVAPGRWRASRVRATRFYPGIKADEARVKWRDGVGIHNHHGFE